MTTNSAEWWKESARPEIDPHLAFRRRRAAKALGISERRLWDLTAPRGPIPVVRLGNCVLYPVHLLQRWLEAEAARQAAGEGGTL